MKKGIIRKIGNMLFYTLMGSVVTIHWDNLYFRYVFLFIIGINLLIDYNGLE